MEVGALRARQLQTAMRLTPLAMVINVAIVGVLTSALWRTVPHGFLLPWAAAVTAVALLGLAAWRRSAHGQTQATVSQRAVRYAAAHAALLALAWGTLPASLLPELVLQDQMLVGLVSTGLICAGGFALSSIPGAAAAYVTTLGACCEVALLRSDMPRADVLALMLAACCVVMIGAARAFAGALSARLVAEAKADRQSEVIGLLLRDFEDHASDVLWEIDATGRFTQVSKRLVGALGAPLEDLSPSRAAAVLRRLVPDEPEDQRHWRTLVGRLRSTESFRDEVVSLQIGGEVRWVSISARPLQGGAGEPAGWRGVASDVTEKHLAHRRLSWLAHNDALTGLVNRTQFRELLRALLSAPAEEIEPFAVVAIDLDGFKEVNDSRGHTAGDQVLQSFASRLAHVARRADTVARLGGDEFALLLRGTSDSVEIAAILERLRVSLHEPGHGGAPGASVRASMGIAIAPTDGVDVDTLMTNADMALYAAKEAGGCSHRFFHHAMAEVERRRAAVERELRGATERGEFHLVYQPQVHAGDWELLGFEALLRWTNPTLGAVSPVEFIPVAEATGQMPELGAWVLEAAATEAAGWPEGLRVSVNVSAPQLAAPDFARRVKETTRLLPPDRIELEVTESALVDDTARAVAMLNELRELGFQVALDDFGTGYSALGYLRQFAFDTLKIDRSFVLGLAQDGEALVIIETILAMARALGMATVAEGVESRAEATMLRERGCAALQGYLIGKPMGADEVLAFVRAWEAGIEDWRAADDPAAGDVRAVA